MSENNKIAFGPLSNLTQAYQGILSCVEDTTVGNTVETYSWTDGWIGLWGPGGRRKQAYEAKGTT